MQPNVPTAMWLIFEVDRVCVEGFDAATRALVNLELVIASIRLSHKLSTIILVNW
jgi:hypothetical protein